ncbi:HNH endonuclease [Sulfitobacter geojensis]|uniref:HNH endonuclease n=1 Tax=Sulfitobacter geojensis TaxID=1342299 RepID=A0AAE3B821_9RHOB|nr:HNH endonuclease signature motif containing protein [Sulfitobacter geojensis]MBM1690778.1 HNH endonuclease [Sulfitobacter geojensis]MBM1694844.1 HNH endonuclease [Sulfitobacter geojensis]MBM1707002.1 HNH endonuclease [Sulfitobacter geojensis]MBM1711060.1 HNH endonuclease [Sulfitobacter geojensis]MBM1715126.1 HNH endonuclease [Sulfitobacter geojensis]
MKRLDAPDISFKEAFDACIEGVGRAQTKKLYQDNLRPLGPIEQDYAAKATSGELYLLPRIPSIRKVDQTILGDLRKSHLVKLYDQYLRQEGKPGRSIYQRIKVSANGKCPFCGGIGHVRTLDHFVPKANFPTYSVVPGNLVPCCRDCNSDKLNSFPNAMGAQVLHPYFEDEKYFSQQWVHARIIEIDPPVVEFYVLAPEDWGAVDRQRVEAHFLEYGLADKFGIEAAADLPETIQTRTSSLRDFSPDEFSNYLLEKSRTLALPINNWRRVMFLALANSDWFCSRGGGGS